jgi:cytochrome c
MLCLLRRWARCFSIPSTSAIAVLSICVIPPAWGQITGNVVTGKALYEAKCGGCHSVDANRIGPLHRGIIGRKIASVPDFDYSPAIRRLHGVWTPKRLDRWLQGPQAVAPGTLMYLNVEDLSQRRDIIAYLATLTSTAPTATSRK